MTRLSLLIAFCAVLAVDVGAAEKPNVIVIMADDIGFECYSSYGSEFYSTPNIDKLAATGVRFPFRPVISLRFSSRGRRGASA